MIYKNAISYRRFNSGGPGGQHQNTTENAIEAILDPAVAAELGIPALRSTVSLKSQHSSLREARKLLVERIRDAIKERDARERYGAGHKRVRNYHQPDDRVTDSTGLRWTWRETVGKSGGGTLEKCIEGRARAMAEKGR